MKFVENKTKKSAVSENLTQHVTVLFFWRAYSLRKAQDVILRILRNR